MLSVKLTGISGEKNSASIGHEFFSNAEIGTPTTMDQDFVNLEFEWAKHPSEILVNSVARIYLCDIHVHVRDNHVARECVLLVLIDHEPTEPIVAKEGGVPEPTKRSKCC
jgi:hypothetical protein